jgi:DNA (cytosine-5)-methyltransferase 1
LGNGPLITIQSQTMTKRRQKLATHKELTVVDVFSGAGGMSTGFANALGRDGEKYKIIFAVDRDAQAMQTFRLNHFPEVPLDGQDARACCADVKEIDAARILAAIHPKKRVDVLIGGPSCQGVSPAGLRNPSDRRNQMLLAFVRLVRELRPKWFVMENVPGLTHSNNLELLAEILKLLEGIKGYRVASDVLLASDYGVPQFRYRLFLIGTRTNAPIRFPMATHAASSTPCGATRHDECHHYVSVADAIRDLADIQPADTRFKPAKYHPKSVTNHFCRNMTLLNKKRIAYVRRGHDWHDIPIKLLPERYFITRSSDQKGSYGRLAWDWPAYTVTNASLNITAGAFTHPNHDRCLSVREVARLQSFSDGYVFHGSVEAQYRQVGNAVPPLMARAVAETILDVHFRPKRADIGRPGRLTLQIIKEALKCNCKLPTLTPRCTYPDVARSQSGRTHLRSSLDRVSTQRKSVWKQSPRPKDRWPDDTRRLRALAKQSKNLRAARRALSIVQFIDGIQRKQILAAANSSEASVRKWIDSYYASGLEGWRAAHSNVNHLANGSVVLQKCIQRCIARVRRLVIVQRSANYARGNRLHMNSYLRQLVRRFGRYSVDQLMAKLQKQVGKPLGTVYVGDLLAIADALSSHRRRIDNARIVKADLRGSGRA